MAATSRTPALPPADVHLRTPLLATCRGCSLLAVWARRVGAPDEHPHADDDHEVAYCAVGDALEVALDAGRMEVEL